jgi:CO/xanthine dehydrogenase FAD-binding subunit
MVIVGVQFRNLATVGATVYSRYGFSDLNTALLALNPEVVLYHAGRIPMALFLEQGASKDILEKVIIPKADLRASFKYLRNSSGDYAILNVAVARSRDEWKIVVGARPFRAMIAAEASKCLSGSRLQKEDIERAAKTTADELEFGTNMRSSREYRQAVCEVLVQRAIQEVIS